MRRTRFMYHLPQANFDLQVGLLVNLSSKHYADLFSTLNSRLRPPRLVSRDSTHILETYIQKSIPKKYSFLLLNFRLNLVVIEDP